MFGSFFVIVAVGKFNLRSEAATSAPVFKDNTEADVIHYNGKEYYYNEGITTILCMGIDTADKISEEKGKMRNGGQSDAIFLSVFDSENEKISFITIPRDTMTEIDIYNVFGEYSRTVQEHLNLQYAYGDGGTLSCELTEKAVSNLMYQIPIHGYLSANMAVISDLNDKIGGVKVEIGDEEWLKTINPAWEKGNKVTLTGEDAETYLRARDVFTNFSAQTRLARHKQYFMAFSRQVFQKIKKNPLLFFDMYSLMKDYSVTNLDFCEKTYLMSVAYRYYFDDYSFYTLKGENVKGIYYDEYYADEEALLDLIVKIFYLPTKE